MRRGRLNNVVVVAVELPRFHSNILQTVFRLRERDQETENREQTIIDPCNRKDSLAYTLRTLKALVLEIRQFFARFEISLFFTDSYWNR